MCLENESKRMIISVFRIYSMISKDLNSLLIHVYFFGLYRKISIINTIALINAPPNLGVKMVVYVQFLAKYKTLINAQCKKWEKYELTFCRMFPNSFIR